MPIRPIEIPSRSDVAALLSPAEMSAIDRLRLVPRRNFTGALRGERLTSRKGMSTEFADYRSYEEGDDLRHVDWNVLARLGYAVTKTYRDEEDLAVHLLLDRSASMEFGEPTKRQFAARLGAGLGQMALAGGDALYAQWLGGRTKPVVMRGRSNLPKFNRWLDAEPSDPAPSLSEAIERFLRSGAQSGIVILITDGLDPRLPSVLPLIGARGHDLMLLQVLSPIELDPDLEGDLRLVDSESGEVVDVTANAYALTEYRKALDSHLEAVKRACERGSGRYIKVSTADNILTTLTQTLKRHGWVRS